MTDCLMCNRKHNIPSNQIHGVCGCGTVIVNSDYEVASGNLIICDKCNDVGLIVVPISHGDRLETAVGRCTCKAGKLMSQEIPEVPKELIPSGSKGTFMGRRKSILDNLLKLKLKENDNEQFSS